MPGFGTGGVVNLKAGVADKFLKDRLIMSSPPTVYKDLAIDYLTAHFSNPKPKEVPKP